MQLNVRHVWCGVAIHIAWRNTNHIHTYCVFSLKHIMQFINRHILCVFMIDIMRCLTISTYDLIILI